MSVCLSVHPTEWSDLLQVKSKISTAAPLLSDYILTLKSQTKVEVKDVKWQNCFLVVIPPQMVLFTLTNYQNIPPWCLCPPAACWRSSGQRSRSTTWNAESFCSHNCVTCHIWSDLLPGTDLDVPEVRQVCFLCFGLQIVSLFIAVNRKITMICFSVWACHHGRSKMILWKT